MSDVNPYFSEDIWFEVLKNLPVKTLGKCRCVCKSWHSLITSPTFITTHLNNYTRNNTNNTFLLYRQTMSREFPRHEQFLFFLDSGRTHIPFQLSHASICPFEVDALKIRQRGSFFIGSVHGLLCLSDKPHVFPTTQIMLWNPFLRKMINLLPPSFASTSGLTTALGFGYDSNKKDHRVVKICYSRSDHRFNPLVEVYSVCKRIWKTIPADYLADYSINRLSYSHCFLNGVIHWLAWETGPFNSVPKWVILFNLLEETFQKIELPESILKMLTGEPDLCEYKTKLSLLNCQDCERDNDRYTFEKCQIWVKEEDDSWCMILNITAGNDHYLLTRRAYLRRDGKLFGFARKSDRVMVFYDVMNRQFIELGLDYSYDSASMFAAFIDSLVLLDQDTVVNSDDERCKHKFASICKQ